ncbi:zinc finger protein 729-like [Culicoides brevitarsis]|uniref:zinc finger protein 729-like n=1 Tax=Culicoides brevitarsis TaxID=469753 RepID=UPI00307B517B
MSDFASIFSEDLLEAIGIDFEPPLPATDRLIEVDDEEIIQLDVDSENFYRCLRCRRIFPDLGSFMVACKNHIPIFQKILYGIQREMKKKASKFQSSVKNVRKSQEKVDQKLICDWCGMTFSLKESLEAHFNVHLNKLQQCELCDGKFSTEKTLKRHVLVVHQGGDKELKSYGNDHQALNCIFCDRPFESVNYLRCHENSHFVDRHVCADCGIVCKNERILRKHQQKHLGLKYPCEKCGALLNSMDSLRGHLKYKHSELKYRCGICNVQYRHRGNYNDHIAGHLDPASKVCEICNYEWDARRSCLEHKKKKHPELNLNYALPKVDPTDVATMEMLRKLIDALPRRNGKPNHLENCMMGLLNTEEGIGLVKKKRGTKRKKPKIAQKTEKIKSQEEKSEETIETEPLNVRKSTRIKERKAKKVEISSKIVPSTIIKTIIAPETNENVENHQEPPRQDSISDDLQDFNRSYATRHDPALEEYDPNYDYTATDDIFVNDFLQDTDFGYDPDFLPTSRKKKNPQESTPKILKPGEILCLICNQATKTIKTHLEHYHGDALLDRVCRMCQKVAMCKRDLKEHVKSFHKKQFSAYQLEVMQKKFPLPKDLPPELYCLYCPAKYLAANHLKFHIEVMHPGKEVVTDVVDDGKTGVSCKLCHKSYPSQDSKFLKRHVTSSHGLSLVDCVCFLCGEVFVVRNYLKIHLKRQHEGMSIDTYMEKCGKEIESFRQSNPELQCDDCNHFYVDPEDLSYHREVCHEAKPTILPPKIDETPKIKPVFPLSVLNIGEIQEFKCSICVKTFQKKELYDKHKEQHDFGLLYCPICDKHFSGISQRREHDAYKHGIGRKNYICDHCGEKITRRKALVAHFQLYCKAFKERPQLKWFCAELKQKKKEARELKVMETISGADKQRKVNRRSTLFPFSHGTEKRMCDICAKICCNDYRLMEHGRKVHGIIFPQYEDLYRQDCQESTCPDCGKVFSQLGHFIEHKKTHSLELLTCKTCGIVVKGKKTLTRHELIHKPKTFKCDQCDLMFHQKRTMIVHQQEKHSTTQHGCKYCPQQFKYKATLYEHMKGHEIPNYLRCEICDKDYASRGCLRTHRKRTHPEIYGNVGTKSRHQRPQSWNQYLMQIDNEPITVTDDSSVVRFQVEFLHETEVI